MQWPVWDGGVFPTKRFSFPLHYVNNFLLPPSPLDNNLALKATKGSREVLMHIHEHYPYHYFSLVITHNYSMLHVVQRFRCTEIQLNRFYLESLEKTTPF